jgi:hypothetical protein
METFDLKNPFVWTKETVVGLQVRVEARVAELLVRVVELLAREAELLAQIIRQEVILVVFLVGLVKA